MSLQHSQDYGKPLIPSNRHFPFARNLRGYYLYFGNRKNIIRRHYARKILYVEKKADLVAAANRSKYFLGFGANQWSISSMNFKSLANFILLKKDLTLRHPPRRNGRQYPNSWSLNSHPLQLKKILRSCQNPKAELPQPKILQHLFNLKSLALRITDESSLDQFSKVIGKLRQLQSLHIKYLFDYDERDPKIPIKLKREKFICDPADKRGWGFFYKISKLPNLQRFSLQISLTTLERQSSVVQQDFANFYSASHKFKIETEIYANSSLDIQELTSDNLASILKTTDSLSLQMGVSKSAKKNPYTCQDKQAALSEQESSKILKHGERTVKFYILYKEKLRVNIGCLLTRCENLVSLYLKISGIEVIWDQDYGNLSGKLQTMVLDVDFFGLQYEILDERRPPSRFKIEDKTYEIPRQRKVKFHSGLLELIKQLKTRAIGFETLAVFICLANFKKRLYKPRDFKELLEKIIEEKTKEFFEELESFGKFHRFNVCNDTEDFDEFLSRALAVKNLETVNLKSFL